MSAVSRIVSGSIASWFTIFLNLTTQLFIVPIYLTYWTITTYSTWIAIQGLIVLLTTIEKSHLTFLNYEFLRIVNQEKEKLTTTLTSALFFSLSIGFIQLLLALLIVYTNSLSLLIEFINQSDKTIIHQANTSFILLMAASLLYVNIGGIFIRILSALNHYPRMAWWWALYVSCNLVVPALVVSQGGNMITIGQAMIFSTFVFSVFSYIDIYRLLKKEQVSFGPFIWSVGFTNFKRSLLISIKDLLDSFRLQGIRVILAPLYSASALVAFTTMRTATNVALQGLNTVVHPLMPELMRYVHQRDQARIEAAFGTVWIIIIGLLAPGVVLLQAFVEPLFLMWTRHRVPFDPILFAVFSLTILVYAIIQPATAIITGNNLLKTQLILSGLASAIILTSVFFSVATLGIVGVGIGLLLAEIVSAIGYKQKADYWLKMYSLHWPTNAFSHAIIAVLLAAFSLTALILSPADKSSIVFSSMILFSVNLFQYWKELPATATQHARKLMSNFFLFSR